MSNSTSFINVLHVFADTTVSAPAMIRLAALVAA
jgi:hypothetical protein